MFYVPKLTMITLEYPCTACVIIDGLLKEIMQKVKNLIPEVETEIIILKHPKELYAIDGIEVEKFPIIMLDGEQISAGSLLSTKQIISLITAKERD